MQGFVLATGGNSLLDPALPPTIENQFRATAKAMVPVAELLARGEHVVITHGNGPQVGFMQLRSELAQPTMHEVPLDSLVADSQGALGYMIELKLREELRRCGAEVPVVTIVTEVEVDADDPAFTQPTKPVGKFYTREQAETFERERGWKLVEDAGRGYRRVVPSPRPLRILQLDTIRLLAAQGVTVIACGGGGIPVVRRPDGTEHGVEAVIDKDRASALLAAELGMSRLVITTGVDAVYRDFRGPGRAPMRETTASELKELLDRGEFPAGSMAPKVEAAIDFLRLGGDEALICHTDALREACEGQAGTRVRKG
ncbi:MAG: carbamate kinase [Deltaproteobacteria bacterium]|nr:carbamate kinase [Deltaproteobacteria bacterium]